MKGYSTMSDEDKQNILNQHNHLYNGYAVGNVTSNMTPLTVYDSAKDKEGVTVTAKGEVKTYRNHNINEIAAKNLHYDEIDTAYEFDSKGPGDENLGYNVYNGTKPPYDFDSIGPADPYYGGGYHEGDSNQNQESDDEYNFEDLLDDEEVLGKEETEIEEVNESVKKTLDMFKRFKKFK